MITSGESFMVRLVLVDWPIRNSSLRLETLRCHIWSIMLQ